LVSTNPAHLALYSSGKQALEADIGLSQQGRIGTGPACNWHFGKANIFGDAIARSDAAGGGMEGASLPCVTPTPQGWSSYALN
jgi:hypothetical protein